MSRQPRHVFSKFSVGSYKMKPIWTGLLEEACVVQRFASGRDRQVQVADRLTRDDGDISRG
jgi:hypothetical protein